MLHVAQAAEIAKKFLISMYPDAARPRLEEIEADESEKAWYVTYSFIPQGTISLGELAAAVTGEARRIYKTIKLDAGTGAVTSMKIRTLT